MKAMIKLELPVYWETRKNKLELMSLNWYGKANKFERNKIKKEYHKLIKIQLLKNKKKLKGNIELITNIFIKIQEVI